MSDTKKRQKEPISFESVGGTKAGQIVPVKNEKELSFEQIGGTLV